MKILLLGAKGQVGRAAAEVASRRGWAVIGPSHAELDICDESALSGALQLHGPTAIVNCAAYTSVDRAETEADEAYRINRDGAARVAKAAARLNLPLVHLSTDYVFDGRATSPYVETDLVGPQGVYAKSKESGERAVREILSRHIVVRTSWIYSPFRTNFLLTMLELGANRGEVSVVNDQIGCPTSAAHIAEVICSILAAASMPGFNAWGTYHCAGRNTVTWYGFAREIFDCAADFGIVPPRLRPVMTADFPRPAPRPAYSVLSTQKLQRNFGVQPQELRQGLIDCLGRVLGQGPCIKKQ